MRPLRSLLFVPGHKPSWVEKAWRAQPDGLILDLEDAVPLAQKDEARRLVRQALDLAGPEQFCCVRINSLAAGMLKEDLDAVVSPNLGAVLTPKVYHGEEMAQVSEAIGDLEGIWGMPPGGIATPLLLETALGMRHAYDIATANPRINAILMSAGPGGDAARAIGYQWSKQGTETLYLRSKLVLDSRAAGVVPLINSWYDVADLEGLAKDARLNRSLGYAGMALIHPSHVPVVNQIFTPTEEELAFYRGLLEAFGEAEKAGPCGGGLRGRHGGLRHGPDRQGHLGFCRKFEVIDKPRRAKAGKCLSQNWDCLYREGRMKKFSLLMLALLAMALVLGPPGAAPAADAEFTFVFESVYPKGHMRFLVVDDLLDRIEANSKGRIKFERHYGGEPVSKKEALNALTRGGHRHAAGLSHLLRRQDRHR